MVSRKRLTIFRGQECPHSTVVNFTLYCKSFVGSVLRRRYRLDLINFQQLQREWQKKSCWLLLSINQADTAWHDIVYNFITQINSKLLPFIGSLLERRFLCRALVSIIRSFHVRFSDLINEPSDKNFGLFSLRYFQSSVWFLNFFNLRKIILSTIRVYHMKPNWKSWCTLHP